MCRSLLPKIIAISGPLGTNNFDEVNGDTCEVFDCNQCDGMKLAELAHRYRAVHADIAKLRSLVP